MDVYQMVTDKVLAQLEAGTVPWRQPWLGSVLAPKNLVSDKPYRGINIFLLSGSGYASPYWLTFRQAKALGGSVRKGEHGSPIVFWNMLRVNDRNNPDKRKTIPMLKHFTVFNLDQTDGVQVPAGRVTHPVVAPRTELERKDAAEAIVAGYVNPPKIREGEAAAWYHEGRDLINMPPRETFPETDEWYSTLFHELGHSTGHKDRLARELANGFASHAYGREELVAEMTSTFLAAEAGITTTLGNSSAYLAHWQRVIREDNHAIVVAAGKAQKAADLILGRVPEERKDEDE